jgi:hypothetical protein
VTTVEGTLNTTVCTLAVSTCAAFDDMSKGKSCVEHTECGLGQGDGVCAGTCQLACAIDPDCPVGDTCNLALTPERCQ